MRFFFHWDFYIFVYSSIQFGNDIHLICHHTNICSRKIKLNYLCAVFDFTSLSGLKCTSTLLELTLIQSNCDGQCIGDRPLGKHYRPCVYFLLVFLSVLFTELPFLSGCASSRTLLSISVSVALSPSLSRAVTVFMCLCGCYVLCLSFYIHFK